MVIESVEKLIPIVPFLGRAFGEGSEIILQKTSGEGQGIIAIFGGELSGRKVGDPISEAVRVIKATGAYASGEYIEKYADKADSHTHLKTSVLFLTDQDGELLGTLNINTDMTEYVRLGRRLLAYAGMIPTDTPSAEPYAVAADAVQTSTGIPLLDETLFELRLLSIPPDRLTDSERQSVVSIMNAKGAFDYKGSVTKAASALGISESTVYRYMKAKIRID